MSADWTRTMLEWDGRQAALASQRANCTHEWSVPVRANNRFGRRSTSLYETFCQKCGKREYRNGLSRLKREVIEPDAARIGA